MKILKWKIYKILSITILIFLGIFILFIITERSRAEKALEKNLYKRYGEEFNISALYKRKSNSGTRYQAEYIYPKSYDGTLKEYDSYYWGKGFVRVENFGIKLIAGDTYGGVLLNESANEFYEKKLKELFGENILPVLDISGAYEYTDFEKEYSREEKTISGGIYIFGRVENDEDREWYRKQIYEFVQFMKQTGTFEYVDIEFYIRDERMLSKGFNNSSDREKMKELGNAIVTKTRNKIYQKYDEDYKNTPQKYKDKWLENVRKSNVKEDTFGVSLLYSRITSPKYIKSNGWDTDRDMQFELKEYNDLKDIKFDLEGWKNQE